MDSEETTTEIDFESFRFRAARISVREDDSKVEVAASANLLADALGVTRVTARILASRGISDVITAKAFLAPSLRDQLPDPFAIKNIVAAAETILSAVQASSPITIFCDFDVDGLSAGAQLYLFLQQLGANVSYYTPSRFTEGYGLSLEGVRKIHRGGAELLITVDCGISNVSEITEAKKLGMTVVVLDHHLPHQLPPADVIVDPADPECAFNQYSVCAAGLVWLLLIVLRATAKERGFLGESIADPKSFLDLAALGTICDMVPLHSLNRVIACRGIEALQQTVRPGLVALKNSAGIGKGGKLNAGHVGFALGPRINAAGRVGEAREVLELLTTKSASRAKTLAEKINKLNGERRTIEERVLSDCYAALQRTPALLGESAFALYGKDFHLGVIGIASQRLVEHFHRPATVMAPGEVVIDGKLCQVVKGSVRSIKGFHVAEVLSQLSELLINCGGHELAGGFSLHFKNLEKFQAAFLAKARETLSEKDLCRRRTADIRVTLSEIDIIAATEVAQLAPFGIGNPAPLLVCEDVEIVSVTSISNDHLKVKLAQDTAVRSAVAWKFRGHPLARRGQRVNVAFQPELNTYQGITSVQLSIKELWLGADIETSAVV